MNLQEKEKKQMELVRRLKELTKENTVAWVKNPLNGTYIAKYKDSHFELREQPYPILTVDFVMEIETGAVVGSLADLFYIVKDQLAPSGSRYDTDGNLDKVLAKLNAQ